MTYALHQKYPLRLVDSGRVENPSGERADQLEFVLMSPNFSMITTESSLYTPLAMSRSFRFFHDQRVRAQLVIDELMERLQMDDMVDRCILDPYRE